MSTFLADGKIQLVNGTWHFFYKRRMLDLKCGPHSRPPLTREQAEARCVELMEAFRRETDERAR